MRKILNPHRVVKSQIKTCMKNIEIIDPEQGLIKQERLVPRVIVRWQKIDLFHD